jgi:DNA-directed RNA polymerase subunit RPC12/RpoP
MKNLIKTFESFNLSEFDDHAGRDSYAMDKEESMESENYMFFGNLQTIHRLVGELLEMNPSRVDSVLRNGHNWAVDHVTTAKDDIEEVANFLINEMNGGFDEEASEVHEEYDEYEDDEEEGTAYSDYDYEESDDEYMPEGSSTSYICEGCGSAYEEVELDEEMACNECGGKVIMMESKW